LPGIFSTQHISYRLNVHGRQGDINPYFGHIGLAEHYVQVGQSEKAGTHVPEILKIWLRFSTINSEKSLK
jgi:hypothetical protein